MEETKSTSASAAKVSQTKQSNLSVHAAQLRNIQNMIWLTRNVIFIYDF